MLTAITTNVIKKLEKPEHTSKEAKQHFEKSSEGIATHLNTFDFGNLQYKIEQNQRCRFSKYTGWHLQSSTGLMTIKLTFKDLPTRPPGPLLVRAVLVRKNKTYRHYGVDQICKKHRKEVPTENWENVLQAAPGLEGRWKYGAKGPRSSICFNIGNPNQESGHLEETIRLKCICNDTCRTCDDKTFKHTESSRDLLLVLTLETIEYGVILARRSFGVWPKAVVNPRELDKPERRKPKGGAAQLNKRKEKLERERGNQLKAIKIKNTIKSPSTSSNLPKVKKENTHQLTFDNEPFKRTSKITTIPDKLLDPSRKQTCNILLPVESKHEVPTIPELMDSTIDEAIRIARKLSLNNVEFITRIEERWSVRPPC